MSALSLLALLGVKTDPDSPGHWGNGKDGQYDFIPDGGVLHLTTRQQPTKEELTLLAPLLAPVSMYIIKMHLGRLALIKKIGNASEMTMPSLLTDMAFELAEFSQLAILLAFREIKRSEGAWMPELGVLIKACKSWQTYVDSLYQKTLLLEQSHA